MEGVDVENGSAIARPEADAAAATKEAAIQVVAAMSRRVRGGDKAAGIVAGYARPGADKLHTLRDVDDLRLKSTEAVVQRPGCKVGGLLGLYQQRMPAVVAYSCCTCNCMKSWKNRCMAGTLILYNLSTVLNTRPAWHISNKAATLSSTGFENGPHIPSP